MNSLDINRVSGVIRSVLVFAIPVIVGWLALDKDTIDQITPQLKQLIESVLGTGGTVAILAAIWSAWSNRPTAVVKQAGAIDGVIPVVYSEAPRGVRQLARDPKVPGVALADHPGDTLPVVSEK